MCNRFHQLNKHIHLSVAPWMWSALFFGLLIQLFSPVKNSELAWLYYCWVRTHSFGRLLIVQRLSHLIGCYIGKFHLLVFVRYFFFPHGRLIWGNTGRFVTDFTLFYSLSDWSRLVKLSSLLWISHLWDASDFLIFWKLQVNLERTEPKWQFKKRLLLYFCWPILGSRLRICE